MRNVSGWSMVSLFLIGSVAVAQQVPTQPNVRPGLQPGGVQQQPGVQKQQRTTDQQIAAVIAICNRTEVQGAKLAISKLQSSEAKELATMLIKDHTEAANKFAKWAGEEVRRDNEEARTQPAPRNPGVAGNPQPLVALKPATGNIDWVSVHQEMADEALATCTKELSRYEGKEFDKAFLGHQIGGHLMAAANLRVLKRHASSQLGTEIDDAIASTESHLKQIRELMNEKKDEKN